MPELDDHQLLGEFVHHRSEAAFTELVSRYAGLVYSTSRRFCDDPHHAEEIAQAVFIILARKAETISPRVVISGWLYQTARLTAANFIKGETRRRRREQEAFMQSASTESDPTAWQKIAPLLDEAMGALGETDRNAVLLRYFENRTSSEIGGALRMSEETARKRVNRALDKLRHFFTKRGVTLSGTALSSAISANSVQSVPAVMIKTISAVALAKGAAASASTLTLAKGALKLMAWTKTKTTVVGAAIALLGIGATTFTIYKLLPAREALTPLPKNISIQPPSPAASGQAAALSGAWLGSWGHQLPSALIVEKVSSDDTARVIYSWGNFTSFKSGWTREMGYVSNGNLRLTTNTVPRMKFTINPNGTLSGRYETGGGPPSLATLTWVSAADMQKEVKTPLPNDVSIQPPPPGASGPAASFSGAWVGTWGHKLNTTFIVEKISSDGIAHAIYSWGDSPWFKGGWAREIGSISNSNLELSDSIRISFALNPDGTLSGRYEAGDAPAVLVTMHRVPSTNPAEIRKAVADRMNFQ